MQSPPDEPRPAANALQRRAAERPCEPFWWPHVRSVPAECLGLAPPRMALRELTARGMIADEIHFRSHEEVDENFAQYIEDRLEQFPYLGLRKTARGVAEWPSHVLDAIRGPSVPAKFGLNFSVDVVDNARRILAVSAACQALGDAFALECRMRRALVRYAMFLDLAASPAGFGVRLVPALDIAFVQLAHVLRTDSYRADARLFTRPVTLARHWAVLAADGAAVLTPLGAGESASDVERDAQRTRELWRSRFGEEYVTSLSALWTPEPSAAVRGSLGADALARVSISVTELLDELRWRPGADVAALDEAAAFAPLVHAYERMLYLAAAYPDRAAAELIAVVPHAQLIWRAHQLQAARYEIDCFRLLGRGLFGDCGERIGSAHVDASLVPSDWRE